ncbi:chemotaxis protein CheD [uncultured Desulfobacter sp.]|uniref:chemotaxis protein CheD n=1 Tax=uncultured Desulfobacter sp. TaxID=240139 RepID=UPI0029F5C0FA|nr:chemotaxis protein CheD [uncultured Desulfobacter sp.]
MQTPYSKSAGPFKRTVNQVSIGIGEYFASRQDVVIHTVLGSCVAVCLYDPGKKIGGMNHILMPSNPDINKYDASARYGINAMELLINAIMRLGGNRKRMVAKTFGGANMLMAVSKENTVGSRNVEFVVNFLRAEKIEILSRDFGGHDSRKIFFHVATGEVFLKRVPSMNSLVAAERRKRNRIKEQLQEPADITLFD